MIQETQMVSANTIQMDWIQMGPWTSPDEKGFGVARSSSNPLSATVR